MPLFMEVEFSYTKTDVVVVEVDDKNIKVADLGRLAREAADKATPKNAVRNPTLSFRWVE